MSTTQLVNVTANCKKQFNRQPKEVQNQVCRAIRRGLSKSKPFAELKQFGQYYRGRIDSNLRVVFTLNPPTLLWVGGHQACDRLPKTFSLDCSELLPIAEILGNELVEAEPQTIDAPRAEASELFAGLEAYLQTRKLHTHKIVGDEVQAAMELICDDWQSQLQSATSDIERRLDEQDAVVGHQIALAETVNSDVHYFDKSFEDIAAELERTQNLAKKVAGVVRTTNIASTNNKERIRKLEQSVEAAFDSIVTNNQFERGFGKLVRYCKSLDTRMQSSVSEVQAHHRKSDIAMSHDIANLSAKCASLQASVTEVLEFQNKPSMIWALLNQAGSWLRRLLPISLFKRTLVSRQG